jgi:hypothetical protein
MIAAFLLFNKPVLIERQWCGELTQTFIKKETKKFLVLETYDSCCLAVIIMQRFQRYLLLRQKLAPVSVADNLPKAPLGACVRLGKAK